MQSTWRVVLGLGLLTAASAGYADDSVTSNAYFRMGANFSKGMTKGACYRLVNPVIPRYGNECDHYGEVLLHKAYKADEIQYRAHLNFAFASDGNDTWEDTDSKSLNLSYREAWLEASGAFGKDVNVWVGKRFYDRWYMELWDFFIVNHNGSGFGVENLDAGIGKVDVAVLRHYENTTGTQPLHVAGDVKIRDIKALGGTWRARYIYSQKGGRDQASTLENYYAITGNAFTLNYQVPFASANYQTYLQYGDGLHGARPEDNKTGTTLSVFDSSSFAKSNPGGLAANKAWKKSNTVRWIHDLIFWPDSTSFSLELGLMYSKSDFGGRIGPNGSVVPDRTTIATGIRPTYYLNKVWSVDADIFYATIEKGAPFTPFNPATRQAGVDPIDRSLNKNTFAVVLRPANVGPYVKPQIRTYVTHASWNQEQRGDSVVTDGNAVYASSTSGFTYGVQGEVWW